MTKANLRYIKYIVLVIIAIICVGVIINQIKIKPWEAGFDPQKFRFSKIKTADDFVGFARLYLPKGTPKSQVDDILVEHAGANTKEFDIEEQKKITHGVILDHYADPYLSKLPLKTKVLYSKGSSFANMMMSAGWQVFAFYDEQNRLQEFVTQNVIVFSK